MISVILPSVREEQCRECINGIIQAAVGVPFELIVISDFPLFEMDFPLKWVHEKERKGVIHAINKGFELAHGDYLFTLSDEAILKPYSFVRLMEWSKDLKNSVILTPRHIPAFPFYYYSKQFPPFPFCHRSVIDKLGGVFIDPVYKAFYADPDLGMRAWAAGIPVITCPDAEIYHPNNMSCPAHVHNVNQYLEQDRATFRGRWDHLGEFIDP